MNMRTKRSHQFWSGSAILGSAVLNSLIPLLIHLTTPNSNPFMFHALWGILSIITIIFLLSVTKRKFLDNYQTPIKFSLRSHAFHRKVRKWLYLASIGAIDYGVFIWSTQFVATAVSTTIYELWPVFLVYRIIRQRKAQFKKSNANADTPTISKEHMFLTVLAAVGLLFMLGSQSIDETTSSFLDVGLSSTTIGIVLAITAAYLAGISVSSTLFYGEELYRILLNYEDDQFITKDDIEKLELKDRNLLLWLTLLGRVLSFLLTFVISLVMSLGFALYGARYQTDIRYQTLFSSRMLVGAVLLTGVGMVVMVLLRVGNIGTSRSGVNALNFLAPFLAIIWLMLIGIDVPRFDLFVAGGAFILAINVLIQLKPDEERDVRRFQKKPMPGVRLGFTAFIMSIWVFGVFIYVRDEIMPSSWIEFEIGEYWGLIALSSTIFALILGFRMARLTAQINKEDETMVNLFRSSEHLVKDGVFSSDILRQLSDLDSVKPINLRTQYNMVRDKIRSKMNSEQSKENRTLLLSVSQQLDLVAHSKQQGRDIVELLSLTTFAIVTIGLGLLVRPKGLVLDPPLWSGFLSEIFVLLFVSTIAFLCVNIFDIRRERGTPLLVKINEDYRLFFRFEYHEYKKKLLLQHAIAIIISIMMSATFCWLLYRKWLLGLLEI